MKAIVIGEYYLHASCWGTKRVPCGPLFPMIFRDANRFPFLSLKVSAARRSGGSATLGGKIWPFIPSKHIGIRGQLGTRQPVVHSDRALRIWQFRTFSHRVRASLRAIGRSKGVEDFRAHRQCECQLLHYGNYSWYRCFAGYWTPSSLIQTTCVFEVQIKGHRLTPAPTTAIGSTS